MPSFPQTTPSSPSSRPSAPSSRPKGGFDVGAGKAQQRIESQRDFQARDRTNPWGSSAPPPGVTVGNRNNKTGTDNTVGAGSARPSGRSYDSVAADAQRREESRRLYERGTAPKPTYRDGFGQDRSIPPNDPVVVILRDQVDPLRWRSRPYRVRDVFGTRYPMPPVVIYHDPYSHWFWAWILAQNLDVQSQWAYHHRRSMDDARYRAMVERNKELEARVRALEEKGTPVDPTYVPTGIDRDLMYSDEYVDSVFNPQVRREAVAEVAARAFWFAIRLVLLIAFLAFLVWLVFIKRWGGGESSASARDLLQRR